MLFTRYSNAEDFERDTKEILMRHEIQNNLFFRNIGNGLGREDCSGMVMATVRDSAGAILLTAIRTIPFPLLIYATDNTPQEQAADFLAASLYRSGTDVDLVMSEKDLAERFCRATCRLSGRTYARSEGLALYILDEVRPLALPEGAFRRAEEKDLYFLPYWYADFVTACRLGGYDLGQGAAAARAQIEGEAAYLWEDGIPVSLAATVRHTSDCAFIGSVYTPPQYRERGYGTACVSSLSRKLLADGWKHCALYADRDNPYSNKVYRKIGYREIFRYDQYRIALGGA